MKTVLKLIGIGLTALFAVQSHAANLNASDSQKALAYLIQMNAKYVLTGDVRANETVASILSGVLAQAPGENVVSRQTCSVDTSNDVPRSNCVLSVINSDGSLEDLSYSLFTAFSPDGSVATFGYTDLEVTVARGGH